MPWMSQAVGRTLTENPGELYSGAHLAHPAAHVLRAAMQECRQALSSQENEMTTSIHSRRAHHSGRRMRIMTAVFGGERLLLPAPVPATCLDPDCRSQTTEHSPDCALDMPTAALHRPQLPGRAPGRR